MDPKFSWRYGKGLCSPAHCGYHLLFGLCVFLLHFLATEMHPHQLCYIKTYETLTFTVRMLHLSNAACSAQRPNVA